jgi:hypothetical protein
LIWKLNLLAVSLCCVGCAATSPNYKPPNLKGSESAIVVSGTRAFAGSACLSSIAVDGETAGTVGPQETLVIPLKPGQYFVRWDLGGSGLCPLKEDLAHRLVIVKDGPVLLKLEISGMGKAFIPIVGMFTRPEHRILAEGEE